MMVSCEERWCVRRGRAMVCCEEREGDGVL